MSQPETRRNNPPGGRAACIHNMEDERSGEALFSFSLPGIFSSYDLLNFHFDSRKISNITGCTTSNIGGEIGLIISDQAVIFPNVWHVNIWEEMNDHDDFQVIH